MLLGILQELTERVNRGDSVTINNSITKCTNVKCPKAKYCYRITVESNPVWQPMADFSKECLKNGKYEYYRWNGVK